MMEVRGVAGGGSRKLLAGRGGEVGRPMWLRWRKSLIQFQDAGGMLLMKEAVVMQAIKPREENESASGRK